MGNDKRRNEGRGAGVRRGPLPDAVLADMAMLAIVLERGRERTAEAIQDLRQKRMPRKLTSFDRTLDLWLKLDSVPFMLIGEWLGQAEGLYLMARTEEALVNSVVPYAVAYARANGRRCAFMMDTDDALTARLQATVAIIEGSVWPGDGQSEPIRLDEAEFDEPFETECGHILLYYEARMRSARAAQRATRQLVEPLVMRRGDGWFQFQVQHGDGREVRLMVPPTHWRFRGGPPPIAKRPLN
jgi:hypothetical protein